MPIAAKLIPVADSALLVEFDNRIDPTVNSQVLNLMHAIQGVVDANELSAPLAGIIELVPSYRSLLVEYDCTRLALSDLSTLVNKLLNLKDHSAVATQHWRVPVCYGGAAGCDLDDVAKLHDMSTNDVIRLHCETEFRAYMLGFAPGWCYLGGLPEALHTPRLDAPRLKVPAGCISIGGQQGMIGALEMPSGWRLLGQTPIRNYDPTREPPFLIKAGDTVSFYEIDTGEHARQEKAAAKGELTIKPEPV